MFRVIQYINFVGSYLVESKTTLQFNAAVYMCMWPITVPLFAYLSDSNDHSLSIYLYIQSNTVCKVLNM